MHKITLICSGHREDGLCNAEELLKILRKIEPEVVFEEIRPSDHMSLEAKAITKYQELKLFQRVSVDQYSLSANLYFETQRVFDCVDDRSQEYRLLMEENYNNVRQHGFKYLNSVAFATVMERKSEIEEKTIIATSDLDLIRGLKMWRHVMQRRELEMIGNIYEYCRKNVFETGVFIVGAGHKMGVVKEIGKYASIEGDLIIWNFAFDQPLA